MNIAIQFTSSDYVRYLKCARASDK